VAPERGVINNFIHNHRGFSEESLSDSSVVVGEINCVSCKAPFLRNCGCFNQ
jgi:hypothetical protein